MSKPLAPDVQRLADLAAGMKDEYPLRADAWAGSPFQWMICLAPGSKGKIGKDLVAAVLRENMFDVSKARSSQADLCVNGKEVEIKFSMLWQGGIYKFQQLRNQAYEFAVCLGISPFDAHCWIVTKMDITRNWKGQHGGKDAKDTSEWNFAPTNAPEWFKPRSGRLPDAIEVVKTLAP